MAQFHTLHPDHYASFGCMVLVLKQIIEIIYIDTVYKTFFNRFLFKLKI